jgi:membrane protease YdiL (CAAX protease family)
MSTIIPQIKTAIVLMIYGLLFASIVTVLIIMSFPGMNEMTVAQIGLLIGELFLPIPILLWARRNRNDLGQMFRINPVSSDTVIAAIPIALGLTILTDEMDRIAQRVITTPDQFYKIQEVMTITGPLSAVFIIGVVVLIAPFVEELIFRGFFQRVLELRLSDITKSVLYSALTFAIIHFNPWWVVQIYIIGIFMGYVAWRTNSIWISFMLHAINNGIAVWFTHQSESSLQWYEFRGHVSPIVLLIGLGMLLLGLHRFIRVTPITKNKENFVFIEDLDKNPSNSSN